MALVICPECKKGVSEHAEACQNCGFPIKKFMLEHELADASKMFLCPKCGKMWLSDDGQDLICSYCKSSVVQSDKTDKQYSDETVAYMLEKYPEFDKIKSLEAAAEYKKAFVMKYAKESFDEKLYNSRMNEVQKKIEKEKNVSQQISKPTAPPSPKCPTCGSTNISKISATSRIASVATLGLFSKKINKSFKCKSCGYTW